jgi:hypothetical protein
MRHTINWIHQVQTIDCSSIKYYTNFKLFNGTTNYLASVLPESLCRSWWYQSDQDVSQVFTETTKSHEIRSFQIYDQWKLSRNHGHHTDRRRQGSIVTSRREQPCSRKVSAWTHWLYYRVSAPIKILDIEEACLAIGVGNSAGATRVKPVNIPSDDDFFEAMSPRTSFTNLKGEEKNNPLNDRPNHMLLHLRTFELTEGAQSMDASLLAFKIIENIQELSSSAETEEDRTLLEQEKESMKVLLAYLWVITNLIGRTIPVSDVGNADDALDDRCNQIRSKLNNGGNEVGRGGGGVVPAVNFNLEPTALAATQAALLTSVNAPSHRLREEGEAIRPPWNGTQQLSPLRMTWHHQHHLDPTYHD